MPPRYMTPDPFAGDAADGTEGSNGPSPPRPPHGQGPASGARIASAGHRPPPPAPPSQAYPTYDSQSDTVHVQQQPPVSYAYQEPYPTSGDSTTPHLPNQVSLAPTPALPPQSSTFHNGPRFPSAPAYPPTPAPHTAYNYNGASSDGHRNVTNPFENTPQISVSGHFPQGGVMMTQAHDDSTSYYHDDGGDVPLLNGRQNYGYAPASAFTPDGHLISGANVQQWGDADGIEDDDAVDGGARGRKLLGEGGDVGSEDYFPGGWASNASNAEDGAGRIRYGRIPQRVPRRYKTLKRVELYHGNLVLDCPVPSRLLERLNDRESREFTHMRYTAATCDPDKFKEERYTLRQVLFDPPRRTELFIVLTMYNEDEELFCRTLHGVMTNIAHLCTRERSKTWGKEGWKKVVVCIVSDGRLKINARVLSVLAAMGVYQEGVGKNVVNGKPVTAHIYEYTTQLSVDPDLKFRGREKGIMPVQILFCLKERNQKKINSHRWFFNAFGSILQPNVCVLLDVGTMPRSKSIYHLWKAFDINSNVAGACGEIVALKGKLWTGLLNPLVAAQNFEYKMSNILDKPMESVFGYISVLPGAFSAYRYLSLQNDALGQGPLASYFKGETLHGGSTDADIFTSNMYLAEDRILCWELCAKRDSAWILHYVKSAQAVTDVPNSVPELISQRRRWLNGSFFAGIHSIVKFGYIYRSSHTFWRKFALHIELIYQTIQLIFSWFGMANFFIAFSILSTAVAEVTPALRIPGIVLTYVYVALIVFNFLLAMGNRPAGSKWAYIVSMSLFALLTVWMTGVAIFLAVHAISQNVSEGMTAANLFTDKIFVNIVISLVATYGVWLISSILSLEPWHMFTSIIQYLLMAPSFVNVINIYAFCNTHDVSWGTKGSDKVSTDLGVVSAATTNANEVDVAVPTEAKDLDSIYSDAIHVLSTKPPRVEKTVDLDQKQKDYYATVRTNVVSIWAISNAALAIAIINAGSSNTKITYMAFLLYSVAGLAAFRMVGCIIYLAKRMLSGE